jgi:hypothetical protein
VKFLKIVAILLAVYVGIVVLFESLLGYYQPAGQTTLVITTTNEEGMEKDRVLSSLKSDDKLYVAANHWPRAWYREVLAHPQVQVTVDGIRGDYLVVSASDAEDARLRAEHPLGLVIKLLTGFPPRYFVRLDPV